MAMLGLFKKTAAFHSVRQISLIALPPLRFPALNVEVIGMLVGIFLKNPKKYPDFDFKPLKIPKLQF